MRKYIVGLILILASPLVYADTLSSIRSSVRYKINDSTSTSNYERWSNAELNKRINSVQNFIAKTTRCLYTQEYSTPTAGVREYNKPANCIAIDRVSIISISSASASNQYRKIPYLSMGGLDRDRSGWESYSAGLPVFYYERGDKIGYDKPFSAAYCSTGSIKIDYYRYPADMTSDTDEPYDGADILQVYSDVIVLGVSAKCKQDEQRTAEYQALQAEYVAEINLMIDSLYSRTDNPVQKIRFGD